MIASVAWMRMFEVAASRAASEIVKFVVPPSANRIRFAGLVPVAFSWSSLAAPEPLTMVTRRGSNNRVPREP